MLCIADIFHQGLGYVDAFAVSEGNIFAGTETSGVFLSANNGGSWSDVNNGLTNYYVGSLAHQDLSIKGRKRHHRNQH